jgi:malonate-semialdehyde dehydrogenase (acetylating)/methylmalonate-semialdehyde dehydrogenase
VTGPETIRHWVGNEPWEGTGERAGDVFNPATGETIARVRFASRADVDRVVERALDGYESWCATPLGDRTRVLFALKELLASRQREVAEIITRENGKVAEDALGEVARGLEVVEFACGLAQLLKGQHTESISSGIDVTSVRQPLGAVAGITPFNFPAMVPLWMIPLALACGNAFILKPSERDPSASVALARLWAEAGLPPGVLQVVHGDREAVEALIAHPEVAAVSFVGSTPVARAVYAAAAQHGKRVQALGGAKNHLAVLPDADLERAAEAATSAAYGSAGQRCMAVAVVVAVGEIGDRLVPALAERALAVRVGDGSQTGMQMGPLITAAHRDRVRASVDRGVSEGAKLVVDGRALRVPERERGFFIGPCLFDDVRPEMSIYRDEVFGPLLCVVRVASLDEAIRLIRRNPYGNGASIFTADGAAARRFQSEVDAGMVGINVPIPVPVSSHSFGGWGQSLFGDLHVYGEEGVRFYTRGKVITARWSEGGPDRASFALRGSR